MCPNTKWKLHFDEIFVPPIVFSPMSMNRIVLLCLGLVVVIVATTHAYGNDDDDGWDEDLESKVKLSDTEMYLRDLHEYRGNFSAENYEAQRAFHYMDVAEKYIRKAWATLDKRGEQDLFLWIWLASQHTYAALELGSHIPPITERAADIALDVIGMDEDQASGVFTVKRTLGDVLRAVSQNPTLAAKYAKKVKKIIKMAEPEEYKLAKKQLSVLRDMSSNSGDWSSIEVSPSASSSEVAFLQEYEWPVRASTIVPNPQPASAVDGHGVVHSVCDGSGDCAVNGSPQDITVAMESHALWRNLITVMHTRLPLGFHEKLTGLAVARYLKWREEMAKKNDGVEPEEEEINNAFFMMQPKADREMTAAGMKKWPELYRDSSEYKLLRKIALAACVRHAMKNGRPQKREDLESMRLVLWAAVYIKGSIHFSHVHEQSVCSGVYYSANPAGAATPIIFSDPRGLHPMHIDNTNREREPEPPFHQQYHYYPRQGDMVLFPSYMPHRVPTRPAASPRVAWAFNLEGSIDTWSRMTSS